MVRAILLFTGVLLHLSIAFGVLYPDRILLNEITVDDIEKVWNCQDGYSLNEFGEVTIGYLLEAYPTDWFFLGAKLKGCNLISVGAFIPASLIPTTSTMVTDTIYWYNNEDSFGFAPNNDVFQYFADQRDISDESRYSISHKKLENSDQIGLRAGSLTNFVGDYNDVVYRCSLEPTAEPTLTPPPTSYPTIKPSRKRRKPTKSPISRCAPNKNIKGGMNLADGDEMAGIAQEDLDHEASMDERR